MTSKGIGMTSDLLLGIAEALPVLLADGIHLT